MIPRDPRWPAPPPAPEPPADAMAGARERRIHVTQGSFALGRGREAVIVTLLGSCVATCLYDPALQAGGMNHILLPDGTTSSVPRASYGVHAMELLINGLIRAGAARERLRAKVFGGASVIEGLSDVGRRNADFVLRFLAVERIPVDGRSLGGSRPRHIEFWPADGRVRLRFVAAGPAPVPPPLPRPGPDIELF